jgi:hypothetical protein
VVTGAPGSWTVGGSLVVLLVAACGVAIARDPIDLDAWHAENADPAPEEPRAGYSLGVYPGVSGVLGAPNLFSYQYGAYLSLSDVRSFSLFVGYGEFFNDTATTEIYTVGWGGVRRLPSAAPQRGFHGKFLRYRRWDHRDHGIHHGLSVGTEMGVGMLSLTFELGAARSDRNHWMATAQVALKVALPVFIPLGGNHT